MDAFSSTTGGQGWTPWWIWFLWLAALQKGVLSSVLQGFSAVQYWEIVSFVGVSLDGSTYG